MYVIEFLSGCSYTPVPFDTPLLHDRAAALKNSSLSLKICFCFQASRGIKE